MPKKFKGGVNVGTSSVLVSFVLLCMVSFAALTYISAYSDYNLSLQTAERTTQYYEANRMAELYMANVEGLLSKNANNCSNAGDYYSSIPKLFEDNDQIIVSEEENRDNPVTLSYTVPMNESLQLNVTLKSHYPDDDDQRVFTIESWNTSALQ
ncbi:MAG: hypothetical protein IKX95_03650 [Lachnospiraceae bacterium]|nr:hypothetical protein [Lachnospiraceae bacterium]MBR6469391.1 hypothetical protein [Lachnospiraceae bacterium]MBR6485891.1 hypothetical protein [Lachnospiraceae bacterium]